MSALDGLLLSDGCIQRAPRSHRWHYQQTCREPTLLEWARSLLPGAVAPVRGPYGASGYYRIRTHVDEAYAQARARWYVNGRKVIPADFIPTPASMTAAYLGDGSYRDGPKGRSARLATYAFPVEQVTRLASQLADLGFANGVHRLRGSYHEIVIRACSVDDFLSWLGPCPVPAYARKYGGRFDGTVTLPDGTDFAERMVTAGQAVPYP